MLKQLPLAAPHFLHAMANTAGETVECAGACITRRQPPQVSLQLDTDLCLSPQACALQTAGLAIPHVQCKNAFPQIAIRPESIIYKNRFLGHVDDYVGALPCLHCRGEKGKP